MKFMTIAIALARATQSVAFAPSISSLIASTSTTSPIVGLVSTTTRNTELNLFGLRWRKNNKMSSSIDADINEKEVRALFELWNSALATGDSRIVASRYTKVR